MISVPQTKSKGNQIAGGLMSIFSPTAASWFSNQEAMENNAMMAEQQNQWQSEENKKLREWQENFWKYQFGVENEEWWKRYSEEKEYNHIKNQVARMREAGINPNAAYSNLDGGLAAVPGSSQVSSPGTPSSQGVSPFGFGSPSGVSGNSVFTTIAQMMDSLSKVEVTNLAEQKQKATLSAEVDKLISEATKNSADADYQRLLNSIKAAYGDKQAAADLIKVIIDSKAAEARGDYDKAAAINQKAQAIVAHAEGKMKLESIPLVLDNLKKQGQVYQSEIEKNRASAQQSISQARLNDAVRETENSLRDSRIRLTNEQADNLEQSIKESVVRTDRTSHESAKIAAETIGINQQNENYGFVVQKLQAEIEKLRNEASHRWYGPVHWQTGKGGPFDENKPNGKLIKGVDGNWYTVYQ